MDQKMRQGVDTLHPTEIAMSYMRYTKQLKQKNLRDLETGKETVAAVARRYAVGQGSTPAASRSWSRSSAVPAISTAYAAMASCLASRARSFRPRIDGLACKRRRRHICPFSLGSEQDIRLVGSGE